MNKKFKITENLKKPVKYISYGTAGYRTNRADMVNIMCRASFIAYLKSLSFAGKRIGVMITASHNPKDYNGIKFIDHNGNMLDKTWEKSSEYLVNCEDKDFYGMLNKILRKNSNLCDINEGIIGHVVLGRDSRESGYTIVECIKEALSQVNCIVEDYGILSTPEMHYLIRKSNLINNLAPKEMYLEHLVDNYMRLRSLVSNDMHCYIDTSNGVVIKNITPEMVVTIMNDKDGVLNEGCGADFVKTHNKTPMIKGFQYDTVDENALFASFDGDADRLILFTLHNNFTLVDGDSQAVILARFFKKIIDMLQLKLRIGIVISYYSNGGCLESLKDFEVKMVQTGVKNFVKAAKSYDIGIFFEPNGHGSVIFSNYALQVFNMDTTTEHQILQVLSEMFDPCIGDALANLLIMKCIITTTHNLRGFKENGSRLLSVRIEDKNMIKVNEENYVIQPENLQALIDEEVISFGGRAFIRPSGTEDLVRVYAECLTSKDADLLALKIAQLVYDNCGGVGHHPEIEYTN